MPDLHRQLRGAAARLARQPVPTAWADAEPALTHYLRVGDLHHAIRRNDPPRSADQVVRALVRLSPDNPDAAIVLLDSLIPAINRAIGPATSAGFRREVLTELASVILEADHLGHLDNLATRLAKRAHRRTIRRIQAEIRDQDHLTGIVDGQAVPSPDEVEAGVLDRIQIAEITGNLRRAVDGGQISTQTLSAFVDGKLFPALTGDHLPVDRRATYRATYVIRRHFEHTS